MHVYLYCAGQIKKKKPAKTNLIIIIISFLAYINIPAVL